MDLHVDALLDEAVAPTAQAPGTATTEEDLGAAPGPGRAKDPEDLAARVRAVPGWPGSPRRSAVTPPGCPQRRRRQRRPRAGPGGDRRRPPGVGRGPRRPPRGHRPAAGPATAAVLVTGVAAV
ncbi:hypothetical protein O1L55_22915 [Streptomyces albulus]|nr:hypothetical protein [Streptomyces noursei]